MGLEMVSMCLISSEEMEPLPLLPEKLAQRETIYSDLKNALSKKHQIKLEIDMLSNRFNELQLDAFFGREDVIEALMKMRDTRQRLQEKRQELTVAEHHYQKRLHEEETKIDGGRKRARESYIEALQVEIGGMKTEPGQSHVEPAQRRPCPPPPPARR